MIRFARQPHLQLVELFALYRDACISILSSHGAHLGDLCCKTIIQLLEPAETANVHCELVYQCTDVNQCISPSSACTHLVVCVELLVFSLALPEGLPLGLQRLGQMGVLQALLGILLRQHLDLSLERTQLLPETQHRTIPRENQTSPDWLRNKSKKIWQQRRNSPIFESVRPPIEFPTSSLLSKTDLKPEKRSVKV